MTESMLTTVDNPYSPFDQFNDWFMFDTSHGYDSCSRLARILEKNNVSPFEGLSERELDMETEKAIDEIIKEDITDTYTKATRDSSTSQD